MNTDYHHYAKCRLCLRVCGHVESMEAMEVEVVEAMHWTMSCHSVFARNSHTWSSSSALWTASIALLLRILLMSLIQLHVPPIGLLKLFLH